MSFYVSEFSTFSLQKVESNKELCVTVHEKCGSCEYTFQINRKTLQT